jgi:hypothetical protein
MLALFSRLLVAAMSAFAVTSVLAGEITLFEQPNFGGRRVTLRATTPNFDRPGFNDRASSMVIRDGFWEVCSDAYFRGQCVRLGPGEYRYLDPSLNNNISSVREVGGGGGGYGEARIELYENLDFGGRGVTLTSDIVDFESIDFNDRTVSAIVQGGVWRLCEDSYGRSDCVELPPGQYRDLGSKNRRISSAAIVSRGGGAVPPPPPPPAARSRAILYEGQNFSGRSFPIDREVVPNLGRTGFNDRASSIRIEGGYWLFCSDADFRGTCRTFGPGEYASLPWDVSNKISSGRRIHESYPYGAPPNWGRPN